MIDIVEGDEAAPKFGQIACPRSAHGSCDWITHPVRTKVVENQNDSGLLEFPWQALDALDWCQAMLPLVPSCTYGT